MIRWRREESRLTSAAIDFKVFQHLNTEKSPTYRAVMGTFMDAKARFQLHLRPTDVRDALQTDGLPIDVVSVEAALQQLVEWGNLESQPDTMDVATVEDFYRPRFLFSLTDAGEAAELAIAQYLSEASRPGELRTAALGDIVAHLDDLLAQARAAEPDAARVHRALTALCDQFEGLAAQARRFMGGLQRAIDLYGQSLEDFLAYKERLLEYLERFIRELVVRGAEIADRLEALEAVGVERLLMLAAQRETADALDPSPEAFGAARHRWARRWSGLSAWFLARPGAQAQAEVLRARARAAIPALLAAAAGQHNRRMHRSDRAADYRTLAAWFAEAPGDAEAHRLWRMAFGLAPARHLTIDAKTLAMYEARPVASHTSWIDAPPIEIAPRLRETGRLTRRGRMRSVVDREQDKAMLAALVADESAQLAAARARLATGRPFRLSELETLPPDVFGLLVDLLGEALAEVTPGAPVSVISSDGTLGIRLEPTGDGQTARLETSYGVLSGPDHHVTILDALDPAFYLDPAIVRERNAGTEAAS